MNRKFFLAGLLLALSLLPYSALCAEGQQSNPQKEGMAVPDKNLITLKVPLNDERFSGCPVLPKEGTAVPDKNPVTLKVPFNDKRFSACPVAYVNDKPITIADFRNALSSSDGEADTLRGKDIAAQLDRMITLELILQEARSMGLDEIKELQMQVNGYSRDILLELFQQGKVKDVKADEKEVEKVYQGLVREYLTESAFFEKEDDARKMIAGLAEGKDFGELADQASQNGIAKIDRSNTYLKESGMVPEVKKAIAEMKPGTVSPLITVDTDKGKGFIVVRLIEIRYPEDKAAREKAGQIVLKQQQTAALEKYNTYLYKKYLKIDYVLLDKIDFEAKKPGFEKLLKDKRALVRIKGDKPVTVGDLADELKWRFFHGTEEAIINKRVNKMKYVALRGLIAKRLFRFVALKEGVDKSAEYKQKVKAYEESLIIGKFIEKVVAAEIKANEQTIKDYYEKHIGDFSYPEMVRLESLAFNKKGDAERVLESLNKGADFAWVKQNADGLVDATAKDVLTFGGAPIMTSQLSEDVKKAVAGAKAGDFRLYAGPGGYFYVLSLEEVIPPTAKAYEEVRNQVAERVSRELVMKGIEDWGKKLREAYPVKIYLSFEN